MLPTSAYAVSHHPRRAASAHAVPLWTMRARSSLPEVSNKSWVLAAQVRGLPHTKADRTIDPEAEALLAAIAGYRARAVATGCSIDRMIVAPRLDGRASGWRAG